MFALLNTRTLPVHTRMGAAVVNFTHCSLQRTAKESQARLEHHIHHFMAHVQQNNKSGTLSDEPMPSADAFDCGVRTQLPQHKGAPFFDVIHCSAAEVCAEAAQMLTTRECNWHIFEPLLHSHCVVIHLCVSAIRCGIEGVPIGR